MKLLKKHIILIGFKHVGKSVIGHALALQLNKKYIDLDHEIECLYQHQYQTELTCRQIVQTKSELFFRDLEKKALAKIIQKPFCVISTGGGTPMRQDNCMLMAPHCVVHITAPPKLVFDRIMEKGRPAFFPENEDPWITFQQLWQERETVYKRIADFSVENNGSLATTVEKITTKIV